MWNFLDARLPISARLAMISWSSSRRSRCSPICTSLRRGDISFAEKEIAGAQYLDAIWPVSSATPGSQVAEREAFDSQFGSADARRFRRRQRRCNALGGRQDADRRRRRRLQLTLDPDLDSFYAMDAVTVRMPGIVASAAALQQAAERKRATRDWSRSPSPSIVCRPARTTPTRPLARR